MPQITVNEIDQSVVTRVVSDDKVKIFCPIIASFGPGYDGTQNSIKTFTDVTDFNRAFGYTYAEFNPFTDDHSRMYARELIKKGAAVSVVRINNAGETALFNIDGVLSKRGTTVTTSNQYKLFNQVCVAALNNQNLLVNTKTKKVEYETAQTPYNLGKKCVLPGSVTVKFLTNDYETTDYTKDGKLYRNNEVIATIDYAEGTINYSIPLYNVIKSVSFDYIGDVSWDASSGVTEDAADLAFVNAFNWNEYIFAPQIAGISAKYTGSFGNNLAISITQVNTTRLAESYQYASVSVYYIDRDINYDYNFSTGSTSVTSQSVNSVTLLENKLVSTNPDSPNYFEDVDFEFINITPTETARDELTIIWSNINAHPNSSAQYSGFPAIPLKYKPYNSYILKYNFDAFMSGGTDFPYDPEVLKLLKSGFKGYLITNTTSTDFNPDIWDVDKINMYLEDVYGSDTKSGIIPDTFDALSNLYENFTDPYIYDFDFITSSGFIYKKYKLDNVYKKETITHDKNAQETAPYTLYYVPIAGTITVSATVVTTDEEEHTIKTEKTFKDDGEGHLKDGSDTVGTISYDNKTIAFTNTVIDNKTIIVNYATADVPKVATVSIPIQVSSDSDVYTSVYTGVTPIHQSMLNLVNTRQDCIALFDLPRDYEKYSAVEYSKMLNTSYGTIHHPWCWVNSPDIAGKQIIMVPSYIFLYTFLSNLIDNVESQKWFPPAGVERATARVVVRPDYEIGSVILSDWQNDNISRVNPIMRLKQYGYVIYGQYTTLPAIDLYTHSALESLNVRLISNVVKKKIFDACLNLAFNPNNEKLWMSFYAQLDPFLRYMKYNDGLYDYKIVMDSSTVTTDDINHLRCPGKVFIAPTRTAEFFDIDFIITDAGAVFSD